MNNTLPIGSVIKLKGEAIIPIMIIGFFPYDKEEKKYYDYSGCLYPGGLNDSNSIFLFNAVDIEKVLFKGYSTEETNGWIEGIKEQFEKEKNN